MDREALKEVLQDMKDLQARWCKDGDIDDAEDMWIELPEFLDKNVPKMEKAIES